MDFFIGFPKEMKQHDSIMVIMDRLTNVSHFILVNSMFSATNVAQVFIRDVVRLHNVPKKIVSDRDANFTWKALFAGLGTKLAFSTSYHSWIDGQTQRIDKILEDMLQMYVMHQQWKWEEYLPLVDFTYNNDYQESLRMSPFQELYGWTYNTLSSQSDLVSRVLIGQDMLVDMEQEMQVIKKNLKETQDRHKSYVDRNRLFKEFQVWEQVYLHIKLKNSSLRIVSCAKLASWFCGPFNIIERIGLVAYRLALPLTMKFHDVFHVSFLEKYVKNVDHVIDWSVLQVEPNGEFESKPQCILQKKVLILQNQEIKQVKVKWKHFGTDEATWEMEDQMWTMYPSFFVGLGKVA